MLSKYDVKIILKNRRNIILWLINLLLLVVYIFLVEDKDAYARWYYMQVYNLVIPILVIMAQSNNYQTYMNSYVFMRFGKVEDIYKKIISCDLLVGLVFWFLNVFVCLMMILVYGNEYPELLLGQIFMMLVWPMFLMMFKHQLYLQLGHYRRANFISAIIWLVVYIVDTYYGYIFTSLSSSILALAIAIMMIFICVRQVRNDKTLVRGQYE
ncbi:MAG: hypothetical protein MR210_02705 [Erysipelotrichaceae bacterium]|nr:hypothetical protein [Erysipelotrichaceae bacterium]MDY5252997.1 hypothetical protein [Erysipelotrichaceae bacterium]